MKTQKLILATILTPMISMAQEQNPAYQHAVPDRVSEMTVPILFILAVLYSVVAIFRIKTENKVRQQLIEKGVAEDTIKQMLLNGNQRLRLETLKWSLIIGFTGLGMIICQFFTFSFITFGVLLMCISAGLLTFYVLANKQK